MKNFVSFLLISVFMTACFKKKNYSSTPKIDVESVVLLGDSAKITLHFEDGEGDIGLEENETNYPYNVDSKYYYNLYLLYFEKDESGVWKPGKDLNGDEIVFKNRLLPIYHGKSKAISGTLEYTIEPMFFNPFSSQNDTIKYRIQLIDRELHESEWVETDPIIR